MLSLLGLARRAGKLSPGYDASVETMKKKTAVLIVLAENISDKTKKNVEFEASKTGVDVIQTEFSIEQISKAIGKKAGVVSITSKDFASGLKKHAEVQG